MADNLSLMAPGVSYPLGRQLPFFQLLFHFEPTPPKRQAKKGKNEVEKYLFLGKKLTFSVVM
jgi:hypothetical protein